MSVLRPRLTLQARAAGAGQALLLFQNLHLEVSTSSRMLYWETTQTALPSDRDERKHSQESSFFFLLQTEEKSLP